MGIRYNLPGLFFSFPDVLFSHKVELHNAEEQQYANPWREGLRADPSGAGTSFLSGLRVHRPPYRAMI